MNNNKNNQSLSEMITLVIQDAKEKGKELKKLKIDNNVLISILDGLDEPVYVVDMDTHELLYVNDYMKNTFGKNIVGKKCYEVIHHNISPCFFCKNRYLENTFVPYKWTHKNVLTNRYYKIIDMKIPWLNGHMRNAKIEIAFDITKECKENE